MILISPCPQHAAPSGAMVHHLRSPCRTNCKSDKHSRQDIVYTSKVGCGLSCPSEHCKLTRADELASLAGTDGAGACQQVSQAEQQQVPARPADEEMGEAAAAAAKQQQTAMIQPEEEDGSDIDIMNVPEGGPAARDVPTAEPQLCPAAETGAAPQPDVYDFGSEASDAVQPARQCLAAQHAGLPNGHAAQHAQPRHAGACSDTPAPEQSQPLLSAIAGTDVKAAQPGSQPDQAVLAADAQATVRTTKRGRSVFGGEANADGPHKAAKTSTAATPRQVAQAETSLSKAQMTEFAARAGNLWRDVSPLPDHLCVLPHPYRPVLPRPGHLRTP